MDWFRWYHGTVDDPKFGLVARKAGASVAEVVAVWAVILESASANAGDRGTVGGLDFEAADFRLGLADGKTQAIYAAMADRLLIVDGDQVSAWDKRQPKREDSTAAKRMREYRERKTQRDETSDARLRAVTQCSDRGEEKREEKKEEPPYPPAGGESTAPPAPEAPEAGEAPTEPNRQAPGQGPEPNPYAGWTQEQVDAERDRILAETTARMAGVDYGTHLLRGKLAEGAVFCRDLADAWKARFGGPPAKPREFGRIMAPLVAEHGHDEVLDRWRRYLDAVESRFASAASFASKFGEWAAKPQQRQKSHLRDASEIIAEDREAARRAHEKLPAHIRERWEKADQAEREEMTRQVLAGELAL